MKGTEDPSGLMARRSALIWSIAPVFHVFPDRNRAAINDKFLVLYHKKRGGVADPISSAPDSTPGSIYMRYDMEASTKTGDKNYKPVYCRIPIGER